MLDFLNDFSFEKMLNSVFSFALRIFKIPFRYWDKVPTWFKTALLLSVFMIAIWFAIMTWKHRDEWRNRY